MPSFDSTQENSLKATTSFRSLRFLSETLTVLAVLINKGRQASLPPGRRRVSGFQEQLYGKACLLPRLPLHSPSQSCGVFAGSCGLDLSATQVLD